MVPMASTARSARSADGASARARQADAAGRAWRAMRGLTQHPDAVAADRRRAEELGVTPSMARALVRLGRDERTSMRQLADSLRCDNSYITTVVDALEARGLAGRQVHPTDRRVKIVALTVEGKRVATALEAALEQPPEAFRALSSGEVAQLADLLDRLVAASPA